MTSGVAQDAFRVTRPQAVRGRHIILIDDVMTTGATSGCSRVSPSDGCGADRCRGLRPRLITGAVYAIIEVMGITGKRLSGWLGSDHFFGITLLIFVVETGWLACTSRFPMAFDEAYHFGLIRFFSHHPDPLVTSQAADTYKYGALIQNSSLLYHYLMSFPYRLIAAVTQNPEMQVIALRFINIALLVGTLFVMRRCPDYSASRRRSRTCCCWPSH